MEVLLEEGTGIEMETIEKEMLVKVVMVEEIIKEGDVEEATTIGRIQPNQIVK